MCFKIIHRRVCSTLFVCLMFLFWRTTLFLPQFCHTCHSEEARKNTKGWQKSPRWHPYTTEECPMLSKPWLPENFELRGKQALDYSWLPIESDMKEWKILVSDITQIWKNQTIAFIGDSNTQAQFTALVCIFHVLYGTIQLKTLSSNKFSEVLKFSSTNNISLIFLRSDRLVEKENCRVQGNRHEEKECKKRHLTTNKVSAAVSSFINDNMPDVLLLNSGAHYTRGKHGSEDLALNLFRAAAASILDFVTDLEWTPIVYWRLSHVNLYSNGDWNTFGDCAANAPGVSMENLHSVLLERVRKQNEFITGKIKYLSSKDIRLSVHILDAYSLSLERSDATCGPIGSGRWDCTHFLLSWSDRCLEYFISPHYQAAI